MSANHILNFDLYKNGHVELQFELDVDLDSIVDTSQEVSNALSKYNWANHETLSNFSDSLVNSGRKVDFEFVNGPDNFKLVLTKSVSD